MFLEYINLLRIGEQPEFSFDYIFPIALLLLSLVAIVFIGYKIKKRVGSNCSAFDLCINLPLHERPASDSFLIFRLTLHLSLTKLNLTGSDLYRLPWVIPLISLLPLFSD